MPPTPGFHPTSASLTGLPRGFPRASHPDIPSPGGPAHEAGFRRISPGRTHVNLFGPVPSRRLGRSLGIDLLPHKTCSYNCVYCESGPTTSLTLERRVFVDPDTVLRELGNYLGNTPTRRMSLPFPVPENPPCIFPWDT